MFVGRVAHGEGGSGVPGPGGGQSQHRLRSSAPRGNQSHMGPVPPAAPRSRAFLRHQRQHANCPSTEHLLKHSFAVTKRKSCPFSLTPLRTRRSVSYHLNAKPASGTQVENKTRLRKGPVHLIEFHFPISLFISTKSLSSSNMNSISSVSKFHYSCDSSSLAYPTAYKLLAFFEVTLWIAKWKSYKE